MFRFSCGAPLDPGNADRILLRVVKLAAEQYFIVRQVKGLNPTCVPVVSSANFELRTVSAEESDLENKDLAELKNNFNLFDVGWELALLHNQRLATLTVFTVVYC